jgi:hypothetical protein
LLLLGHVLDIYDVNFLCHLLPTQPVINMKHPENTLRLIKVLSIILSSSYSQDEKTIVFFKF